jgi:hypothetical protein
MAYLISICGCKVKVKQFHYSPGQALRVPRSWGFQISISRQSTHECGKVVSLMNRPSLTPRKYSWYSFLLETESTQGHSAARRIMSMKNSSDTIGNQTRYLPACSPAPQPTTPPRTPFAIVPNSFPGPEHGCSNCGSPQYLQAKSDIVPHIRTRLLPETTLCNVVFTNDLCFAAQ